MGVYVVMLCATLLVFTLSMHAAQPVGVQHYLVKTANNGHKLIEVDEATAKLIDKQFGLDRGEKSREEEPEETDREASKYEKPNEYVEEPKKATKKEPVIEIFDGIESMDHYFDANAKVDDSVGK